MRSHIAGLGGWLKNSFIDFPRTVSTVLFFNRCNLKCPYCHNPSLLDGIKSISERSDQIWNFLEKRKNTIKGIVLSGGEPTLFPTLAAQIDEFKNMGYRIKLDTNGLNPSQINNFRPDYLAMDLKTDLESYKTILKSNLSSANIKKSLSDTLSIIKDMGENSEVRVTMAPNILNKEKIIAMRNMLEGCAKVFIQSAKIDDKILNYNFFNKIEKNNQKEMVDFAMKEFAKVVDICELRG